MQQELFIRLFCTLSSVALAASTAPLPAGAQEASLPPSVFSEVIDVRVVNLEVVVSSKGERVRGLGPEDFVLTVDRKEVSIDYFTEVEGGVALGPGDADTMVPALAAGEPVSTSYLLFIDEMFSIGPRRNLVLRKMLDQLAELGPEDRMAVVAYNGKKLEILSTWTSRIPEIEQVLEEAMDRPSYGMHQRGQERAFLSTARPGPDPVPMSPSGPGVFEDAEDPFGAGRLADGGSFPGFTQFREIGAASSTGLSLDEEQQTRWLTGRLVQVVAAATSSLRSFADPPGRKVMLLMSGGWPDNPTEWLLRDTGRVEITRTRDRNVIYGPLIETANRLSYTLYPIDVPGSSEPASGVSIQRATLQRLAHQTGGRAMLAGDGLHALAKTAADTRSYYWLGFVPPWQGDDREHSIDVKVRGRGISVRTRRNFSDLSRQTEASMMVESSLRLGDAGPAASFPVQIGDDIRKAGPGKVEVPIEMLVPVSELTFLPYEDRFLAEVELRVAVEDPYGTSTDIPVVPLQITLDEPPVEGDMKRWTTTVKIRKQKHDVVVSFYDKATGKMLTSRLEVDPTQGSGPSPRLRP